MYIEQLHLSPYKFWTEVQQGYSVTGYTEVQGEVWKLCGLSHLSCIEQCYLSTNSY